jgi:hypothetical protein
MSDPSPIQPETQSWFSSLSYRNKLLVIYGVILGGFFLILQFEPQGPLMCDYVNVLGTVRCGKSRCFVVRYMATGDKRTVGTFVDKPFGVEYRRGAALFTHRGNGPEWITSSLGTVASRCLTIVGGVRDQR